MVLGYGIALFNNRYWLSNENYTGSVRVVMSLIDLIKTILAKEKNGLHFRDIAEKALIIDPSIAEDKESCAKKVNGLLARNAGKKDSLFSRVPNGKPKIKNGKKVQSYKAGIYALTIKKTKPTTIVNPQPIDKPNPTGFIGKAGEYGVFSELLYWGFNPAMMTVDHGVDIVASKGGKYFHIQVKTANQSQNNSFNFKINRAIFSAHDNGETFYVFVLRRIVSKRQLSDYVIMPSYMVRTCSPQLNTALSNQSISLSIAIENGIFKVNGKHELTEINDFSVIR